MHSALFMHSALLVLTAAILSIPAAAALGAGPIAGSLGPIDNPRPRQDVSGKIPRAGDDSPQSNGP
jgi:hypothetical protein